MICVFVLRVSQGFCFISKVVRLGRASSFGARYRDDFGALSVRVPLCLSV